MSKYPLYLYVITLRKGARIMSKDKGRKEIKKPKKAKS